MIRLFACLIASLVMLTACDRGGQTDAPAADLPQPEQVDPDALPIRPQTAPTASPPQLGTIIEPDTNAYCAFFAATAPLEKSEAGRSEFLLLTDWPATGEPPNKFSARVMLNGKQMILNHKGEELGKRNGWTRWYESADAVWMVELRVTSPAEGSRYAIYEGTLQVLSPLAGEPVQVQGRCG